MLLPSGNHQPNLVVAHSICEKCSWDTVETQYSKCSTCGNHYNLCSQWHDMKIQFEKEPCEGCSQREMVFSGKITKTFVNGYFLVNTEML